MVADVTSHAFAGRLGGNQEFILDPKNLDNERALKRIPDASPFLSVRESFNLRGFLEPEAPLPVPSSTSGIYSTPTFLGPLVGGITNIIILTLFIYSLGPVSGGHLNPIITMSTFTARLTTFPRMVLYVTFQTLGAVIAGLLMRSTYGTRDFLVGGCSVDTSLIPTRDIFALEFMADFTLIFLAFGVGLDPRQKGTFGPALGPILVGLVLGVLSFGTAIVRTGYGGASMNPARCTGAYVGSWFPEYAWVVWIGPISASIIHGVVYWAIPPWKA
ncbi:hypothetical protein OIDMADRAFT_40803 [Oidiodendron maius Zn]|uniref:Aquaporin n=1 Tax=Oidiodendron maius (strain Zn) TaxID=913774 RepID=A0A0C3H4W1_OIDMZ|nr:hypothetical protein OIDMADRAFT_40803 [Oidiodendron maius Zn]